MFSFAVKSPATVKTLMTIAGAVVAGLAFAFPQYGQVLGIIAGALGIGAPHVGITQSAAPVAP